MKPTLRISVAIAITALLLGMLGCTAIGAGVGAVGGSVLTAGSPAGVIGGAIVGGVIGHSM